MNYLIEFVSRSTCVSLLLVTLFVISIHSLPALGRSGKIQAYISHREKRSAMDNDLASELFNRGDLNNDEFLSPSEITNFYETVIGFPSNLALFMATGFMRNGDRNGDHRLDYSETLTAIQTIEG